MSKTLVIVFPTKAFIKRDFANQGYLVDKLSANIKSYVDKNFKVVNVLYAPDYTCGTTDDFTLADMEVLKDGATVRSAPAKEFFFQQNDAMLYDPIAKELGIENEEAIVVGGFHYGECVDKMANAIRAINPNVTIDPSITNEIKYKQEICKEEEMEI